MGLVRGSRSIFAKNINRMKFPSFKEIAVGIIATFFLVQILSLILSSIFPSIPIFKGGPAILLMLLCVAIISLFILAIKLDELRKKENLIFILIVFSLVAFGYWKLPAFFPNLFSVSPGYAETIKNLMGSIFGG